MIIFTMSVRQKLHFSSIGSYLTFTILKKPDDEEELET